MILFSLSAAASAAQLSAQATPDIYNLPHLQETLKPTSEPVPAKPPVRRPTRDRASQPDDVGPTFAWRELRVEGAKALPLDLLRAEWQHEPGKAVSMADVNEFADAITRLYAKNGYMLSFAVVPQQDVQDGVITVRIVEGFIDQVAWIGESPPPAALAMARKIVASRPLKSAELERYLLLMNDIPGYTARGTISPSPTTAAGAVLTVSLARKSAEMELAYNSFMPASLGRHVVGANFGFHNKGASVRFGAWHSPNSNAYLSLSGSYTAIMDGNGLKLTASGFLSKARAGSPALRAIEYHGDVIGGELGLRRQLVRARNNSLFLEAGLSLSNTRADYVAGTLMDDRLRTGQVGLSWENTDSHQAASSVRIELNKGISALGARGDSRANGTTDYLTASLSAQRLQPIADRPAGKWSALASVYGQMSLQGPLYSAAECAYGGRRFGRRFDAGDMSGDRCLMGGLELRYSSPLRGKVAAQLFWFADAGVVWQQGDLIPGEKRRTIASTGGGGIRLDTGSGISGGLELSTVITRPAANMTSDKLRAAAFAILRF